MLIKRICVDANNNKRRFVITEKGEYFVYNKRSKIYGRYLSKDTFDKYYKEIIPKYTEYEKWQKRLRKAIKKMNQSGLWEELKIFYENLLLISETDYKDMKNKLRQIHYNTPQKTFDEMFQMYYSKYPFLFRHDTDGTDINHRYFYEIAECNMKSMYFGTRNKVLKDAIQNALTKKEKYTIYRERVNYDVSFEYRPDEKKAFYSEEYIHCGNGYYYCAIDGNTAIFAEKD